MKELDLLYKVVEENVEPNARKDYRVAYGKLKSLLKIYDLSDELDSMYNVFVSGLETGHLNDHQNELFEKCELLCNAVEKALNDLQDLEEEIEDFLENEMKESRWD